jgi:uncharacterized protein (TIGR03437 family)
MRTRSGGKLGSNSSGALYVICRRLPRTLLLSALLAFSLSATTVQYQVSISGTTGAYQYFVSGFDFRVNGPCVNPIHPSATECTDELDIEFDPNLFDQISNGLAPAGFNLLLFQPNNPPKAPGDYSALGVVAIVDHASLAGTFSVDFTFNPGVTPGGPLCPPRSDPFSQCFFINQFDSNGIFEGVVASGVTVPAPPTVSASPTNLTFSYNAGGTAPAAQSIMVSGGGAALAFSATASTVSGGNWLSVSPTSGNTPASVSASVNPTGLNPGNYTGTVVVSGSNGAGGNTTVNVSLTVTAPLPTITQVVNSASDAGGSVSPGEVLTISGTALGPTPAVGVILDSNGNVSTTSGGVQVLFNGIAAPILYASATQANVIVPYQLAGILSPSVWVKYQGQTSNAVTLSVTATAPGVYTQNMQGSGPAAVYNQNGSVNSPSNPEKKGNVIELFITGEGQTSPPSVTGVVNPISSISQIPKPLLPIAVQIGGQPATITFYGEVPFYQGNQLVYVSGVLQIDAIIPAATASGNVSLVVTVGYTSSQSNMTLSVQ